jgi:hypothetical protein
MKNPESKLIQDTIRRFKNPKKGGVNSAIFSVAGTSPDTIIYQAHDSIFAAYDALEERGIDPSHPHYKRLIKILAKVIDESVPNSAEITRTRRDIAFSRNDSRAHSVIQLALGERVDPKE